MEAEQVDHYAQALVTDLDDLDARERDRWRLERIEEWGVVPANVGHPASRMYSSDRSTETDTSTGEAAEVRDPR